MPQISSTVAQVVAIFVECAFYGIHFITFAASIHSIALSHPEITWTSRFKRQQFTLLVVFSIFVLSTLNLAMGLLRTLALLNHDCLGAGLGEQLGQDWLNVVKIMCFQLQTDIADCILIYRCWVVCNKSLRAVILPTIFYMGLLVSSIMVMVAEWKLHGGKIPRLNGNQLLLRLAVGFWVSTISLNIYASSMIVLRIWRVESKSRGRNTLAPLFVARAPHLSRLQIAMKAVIESALIYTITSIVTFLTHITGSNSVYITTAVGGQVVGIALNLVLIRVNQHDGGGTVVMSNTAVTAIGFAPESISVSSSNNVLVSTEQRNRNSKVIQIVGCNS
ncbi:hypothetical protein BDZ94DRAFT_1266871 [Collybia nuda]|uniref:Uncharacterized protein n=1 Tax=Collybia nuda TaxID=64659 RepID=A0A9P5Y249_9AGAR|nr:hypothetical protein BDZ94DRAFT_1266871 [Collybia nuda]